jgi:hypothetical protein
LASLFINELLLLPNIVSKKGIRVNCNKTVLKRVIFSWGDVKKISFSKKIFLNFNNPLSCWIILFKTTLFLGIKKEGANFAIAKDSWVNSYVLKITCVNSINPHPFLSVKLP